MDSFSIDPTSLLMDSSLGVTIYDKNFELISWNDEYSDLGITPKSDLKEGLHLRETYSIAYRLGVFDGNRIRNSDERFQITLDGKSPEHETLNLPCNGKATIKRLFLPKIGVAALFLRQNQFQTQTQSQIAHCINNRMAKILINLELAFATGDEEYFQKARDLCSAPVTF